MSDIEALLTIGDLTFGQSKPFWPAFALMLGALLLFIGGTRRPALLMLVLGSGMLAFAMASLDPFLWQWDEQYHALVAKRMVQDPLRPVLLEHPIFGYDPANWTYNHIWLHKQPLFLWQMALSIGLFGNDELAVRLPGILMLAVLPLLIYRMGSLAVSAHAGFYAAMFMAFANFPLELLSGAQSTDHNDVAFLFYGCAGMWAWFEHGRSQHWGWLLLMGLFAGCAILVKWLTGLLVFGMWGVGALVRSWPAVRPWGLVRSILPAIGVCAAVVLPWQVYIHWQFPVEAAHEYAMMHRHFSHAIEGHAGDILFHFEEGLHRLYGSGDAVPWLLLAGLLTLSIRTENSAYRYGMLAGVAVVYGFYSLAETKMVAFPLIVTPIVMLGLGALTDAVFGLLKQYLARPVHTMLCVVTVTAVCAMELDMNRVSNRHSLEPKGRMNIWRANRLAERGMIRHLEAVLPSGPHVLFNAAFDNGGYIQTMFYLPHPAFGHVPSADEIDIVRLRLPDHRIVIIDKGSGMPEHIMADSAISVIRFVNPYY